jgi:hypothetical protein
MSDARWRRIEEICHDALERPPGARGAFVHDACVGDNAMRTEVESLLANASAAADSALGSRDLGLELIGRQIGALARFAAQRSKGLADFAFAYPLGWGKAGVIYAMRIDPSTGKSRSEPFLVAHIHDASRRWGSTGYGSAVVRGMFVANFLETTGNLWMTTLESGR